MAGIFKLYRVGEIERMRNGDVLVPTIIDVPEEISPHSPEPVTGFASMQFCPKCLDRADKMGLSLQSCVVIECLSCDQFVWCRKAKAARRGGRHDVSVRAV